MSAINCFTYPCKDEDGSYYDANGNYIPFGHPIFDDCIYQKNGDCVKPNLSDFILPHDTVRPLTNTIYVPMNNNAQTIPPPSNQVTSMIGLGDNVSSGLSSIVNTVKNNPLLVLGGLAVAAYLFFNSEGGTYEQVTTKRKGF